MRFKAHQRDEALAELRELEAVINVPPPRHATMPLLLRRTLSLADRSGAVCMDLLQSEWSPAVGVVGLLLSFRSLLVSHMFQVASCK